MALIQSRIPMIEQDISGGCARGGRLRPSEWGSGVALLVGY